MNLNFRTMLEVFAITTGSLFVINWAGKQYPQVNKFFNR